MNLRYHFLVFFGGSHYYASKLELPSHNSEQKVGFQQEDR